MRILVVTYSLTSGGAERFVVDWCNALVRSGHEVYLLATNDGMRDNNQFYLPELSSQVHYTYLKARTGRQLRALLGVARYVRKIQPDIVHANSDLLQLLIPAFLYRKPRYFDTLHNMPAYFLPGRIWKPVFKAAYAGRVHPVTISPACSQAFRALYGLQTDTMIENGRCCPPKSEEAPEIAARLARFKDGKPLFIHIARYSAQKNQNVLFKAFGILPDARLLVLGDGYPEAVKAAQNPGKVLFAGVQRHVGDYLACADFFVLSSLFEGLPLSLLEAMAYGVVPVSTPAGGVVDVIKDGESGFLARDFSAEALAQAMKRALEGSVNGDSVRTLYESRYSMETCSRKYLQLFEDSLK